MKLLVLSHVSDFLGGAERSLVDIIDVWRREDRSLDVRFIIRKPISDMREQLEKRGIPYDAVDFTYWNDSNLPDTPERIFNNAVRNTRAIERIEEIIQVYHPDIVLTNSIIAPWAAIAAHYQGIPHVWMVREYGKKDHGRDFEIGERQTFEDIGYLSELVFANSQTLSDFVAEYVPREKIATIYTPFDIKRLNERAIQQDRPDPYKNTAALKTVLTGNIAPGKGQLLAIEAIGLLKQQGIVAELALVGREGTAEHMAEIGEVIKQYDIADNVHFLGYQDAVFAYIKHADVAIMASRMEAFGRVTFEYAALGKPVVGSKSGATPEIVIDGKTGYLYAPNEAADLASKLRQYVENVQDITRHGKAAARHAQAMMRGSNTAQTALDRIKQIARQPKPLPQGVFHYSKRWLRYPQDGRNFIHYMHNASLSVVVKERVKNKLRPYYHSAKGAIHKRMKK